MLSQQRSLEQERAARAWDCVQQAKQQEAMAREYGALARGAPADVQSSGLGQSLAFWRAKGFSNGAPSGNAHARLYGHVSDWLRTRLSSIGETDVLEWIASKAVTDEYRRATVEAIAFFIWVKRFAEAELPRAGQDGA